MKPTLAAQARPQLRWTPGVQMALEFLQIPALELRSIIGREILANPLLELEDDPETAAEAPAAPSDAEESTDGTDPWDPRQERLRGEDAAALPRGVLEHIEPAEFETPAPPSLRQSLESQLRLECRDPALLPVALYLLGCLDERGYIGCPLEDVATSLGCPPAKVELALRRVQALDPPGIGARDLRECLLLQLDRRGKRPSLAYRIVERQFDNLARRRHSELSRRLRVPVSEIERAIDEIRRLGPHPGWLVAAEEVRYIYPDLVVAWIGDRFEVFPSDRAVPRLRVNDAYRPWISGRGQAARLTQPQDAQQQDAHQYVRENLRSARWLVQALDRRRDTMVRVMRSIVEEQRAFFERGVRHLRPLTLQAVAQQVGLHESTVARVTKSKYVQTPRGIFPLKFFFSSRIQTQLGKDTSSRAVRDRIRQLIEDEDRSRPLSDAALAQLLGREGVRIARRTVAKYRDQLGIERAQLRRRHEASESDGEDRNNRRIA